MDHNEKVLLRNLTDDLIFNPDIDFANYIELIFKFYQEMGWKTIYINTHLMQHHQFIIDIFEFHNSIYIEPTKTIKKTNGNGVKKAQIEFEKNYFERKKELKEKKFLKRYISRFKQVQQILLQHTTYFYGSSLKYN